MYDKHEKPSLKRSDTKRYVGYGRMRIAQITMRIAPCKIQYAVRSLHTAHPIVLVTYSGANEYLHLTISNHYRKLTPENSQQ